MRPTADTARLSTGRFATSVVGPGTLECGGGMTELALFAQSAAMHIVLRVTSAAQHRWLDDVLWFQVALGATGL